jgi:hypothetical protein
MIDVEGHCERVDLEQPHVALDFVIQVTSSLYHFGIILRDGLDTVAGDPLFMR